MLTKGGSTSGVDDGSGTDSGVYVADRSCIQQDFSKTDGFGLQKEAIELELKTKLEQEAVAKQESKRRNRRDPAKRKNNSRRGKRSFACRIR